LRVLSIDTATLTGSVALVDDDLVLAESAVLVHGSHSAVLVQTIDAMLASARVELGSIDAFAAGLGPGSFTGVRIGISIAKGFALATERPMFGVCSLQVLAAAAVGAVGPVVGALDARRGEVYFAVYERGADGSLQELRAPANVRPELVGESLAILLEDRPATVVSDLDGALRARVREGAGARAVQLHFAPRVLGTPQARLLATEVIAGRAARDEGAMEPLYVRPIDAKLPSRPQVGR
jgi:tRNA threonylcarbamoyladenosine biosynthesis protein TsaB